jgi:hypothetical protein
VNDVLVRPIISSHPGTRWHSANKSQEDQLQHLMGMIDAIDVVKGGEQTGKALQDLWQAAKTLAIGVPSPKKK